MGCPSTIAEYIEAAPPAGHAHLRRLYEILKEVAPDAREAIKWNTPFFVEPRFLFAFSAFKAHLSFTLTESDRGHFRKELEPYPTTKCLLKIPYKDPMPEALIRKIAKHRLKEVSARKDDSFW